MSSSSSLDEKMSDIVGSAALNRGKFSLNYNFALDQNYSDLNYNEIGFNVNLNPIKFNVDYLQEKQHIGNQEYLKTIGRNTSEMTKNVINELNRVSQSILIPILEKNSGLYHKLVFFVGYSPERINPGDSNHKLRDIKKVVSGSNEESASWIYEFYKIIVD